MILHNPENAKIANEYQYNLLHTAALVGRMDIVTLAVEKVKNGWFWINVKNFHRGWGMKDLMPLDLWLVGCVQRSYTILL